MKKLSAIAAGAVLALSLSGCMRMHTELTVNADDTVDGSIVMAIDDSVAAEAGLTPQDLWDSMGGELSSEVPEGGTVEQYAEDGFTGQKFTFTKTPLDDFGSDEPTGGQMSITHEGDEYVVDGLLDLTAETLGTDDPSVTGMEQFDEFMKSMDIKFSITFPGKVLSSNGEVNGSTVTWTGTYGEKLVMEARADASGSTGSGTTPTDPATDEPTDDSTGATTDPATEEPTSETTTAPAADEDEGTSWLLWVGIGVGALVLVGLAAWLIARNRKNGSGGPQGPGGYGAPVAGGPAAWGQPGQDQQWGQQPGQTQPGQDQQWGQQGYPTAPVQQQGYPAAPGQQGYPAAPAQQGYPTGPDQQGYPTAPIQQTPGQQQWGQPEQPTQQWPTTPPAPGQQPDQQPGQQWGPPTPPPPPAPPQQQ